MELVICLLFVVAMAALGFWQVWKRQAMPFWCGRCGSPIRKIDGRWWHMDERKPRIPGHRVHVTTEDPNAA